MFHKNARKMKNNHFYEKLKHKSFKQSSKLSSAKKFLVAHHSIFLKMNARFGISEKSRFEAFTQESLKELGKAENRQKNSHKSRIHF